MTDRKTMTTTPAPDPYDVAEALAGAADPCLDDGTRSNIFISLHGGEPFIALSDLLHAITAARYPIPHDIVTAARGAIDWLLDGASPSDHFYDEAVEMRRLVDDVHSASATAGTIGTFGDAHMGWIIISDAGLTDAATHGQKAAAIRAWLADNKPGWALRYHLPAEGFGYLLD